MSTMCAEVSAEFALWEPDDVLLDFVRSKSDRPFSQHGRIRMQAMPTCSASIWINWCLTFQEMTV